MEIKKAPLTLKEKMYKKKMDKLEKKIIRLTEDKMDIADNKMNQVLGIVERDAVECVNKFIEGVVEEDTLKQEKYSKRFVNLDKKLHGIIKNDDWTEAKSYQTFDMMVEESLKAITQNMIEEYKKEKLKEE